MFDIGNVPNRRISDIFAQLQCHLHRIADSLPKQIAIAFAVRLHFEFAQLFNIVNAMRLELADRGKILGIIRDGGDQAIYIPDHCSAEFTIRSFSMKYNIVWDKLFDTGIMAKEVIASELASNLSRINKYGMPLDNRAGYTKSDWLVWTATLAERREDFERMTDPLWDAYNSSYSRCPMTDWYDTVTARQIGFRHRSVQGGLFIKLLDATGKMKV